jgi:hypothetical protein
LAAPAASGFDFISLHDVESGVGLAFWKLIGRETLRYAVATGETEARLGNRQLSSN